MKTCQLCNGTNDLRIAKPWLTGLAENLIWCFICFRVWYDEGIVDSAEITRRSLAHQGRES